MNSNYLSVVGFFLFVGPLAGFYFLVCYANDVMRAEEDAKRESVEK
jgi:hypothetical protein